MHNRLRFSGNLGFTMLETIIVMMLIVVASGAVVVGWSVHREHAKSSRLAEYARVLNASSMGYLTSGGSIDSTEKAADVLVKLQTKVDDLSQKAGFGNFPQVDYRWTLVQKDSGDRLIYTYNVANKAPSWSVAKTGTGYDIEIEGSKAAPQVADWTARVDKAGQTGARKQAWLWDAEKGLASTNVAASPNPGSNDYTKQWGYLVSMAGPDRIFSSGPYFWRAAVPRGQVTMTFINPSNADLENVLKTIGTLPTRERFVETPAVSFPSNIRGTFQIVASCPSSSTSTVTRTVTVNIPALSPLSITGPDAVYTKDPVTWGALCIYPCTKISIDAGGQATSSAENATTVSVQTSFPEGTNTTITILATGQTANGQVTATKQVKVNIPSGGSLWFEPPGTINDPSYMESKVITKTGNHLFHLKSLEYMQSMDATAMICVYTSDSLNPTTPPDYQSPAIVMKHGDKTMDIPFEVPVGAEQKKWVLGYVELTGAAINLAGQEISITDRYEIKIPPQQYTFSWTVKASNIPDVDRLALYITGVTETMEKTASQCSTGTDSYSATFTRTLEPGTYTITGKIYKTDGSSIDVPQVNDLTVE